MRGHHFVGGELMIPLAHLTIGSNTRTNSAPEGYGSGYGDYGCSCYSGSNGFGCHVGYAIAMDDLGHQPSLTSSNWPRCVLAMTWYFTPMNIRSYSLSILHQAGTSMEGNIWMPCLQHQMQHPS